MLCRLGGLALINSSSGEIWPGIMKMNACGVLGLAHHKGSTKNILQSNIMAAYVFQSFQQIDKEC
jgi:hypothetical protein